ncbi:sialate O-acetylesterase [Hymenobacter sp. GOD-10R]|uniref:sialate O-acetylesterase n=1 Tax=Hymenobacter sp. GOD-10R TaxID=3093922 RepID=UPI002D77C28C|nr:sialate O-acetylesterase [Hymenobacter sp. GOD-10R]WRQ31087.1 sialate O-acetylesterase [Hymenobacter sp. GOD-10R]
MVLQRNQPIPVWGWADKGESLVIEFHNQTRQVKAGADGKWQVALGAESAGGPYTLRISGQNKVQLKDVLVGDVWICSGQSNMGWPLASALRGKEEIAAANYPQIRQFKVHNDAGERPKDDLAFEGSWKPALPAYAGDFTAIGYFFACDLYKELNVPIGLINTSWGGTDIETWISKGAYERSPDFSQMIAGLPAIDLGTEAKAKTEAIQGLIKRLQGQLPTAEAAASWRSAAFNDSSWPTMNVPQLWEQDVLKDLDGTVWFRKAVDLAPGDAGKEATLALGVIDDNDQTYVNGTKVGATTGYTVKRAYSIPQGVLKPGKNVIAIRVEDTGGGGGLYGEANELSLKVGEKTMPLAGLWSFGIETVQTNTSFINPNSYPTILYNAMIHPLLPIAMKGVLWYQGENNAGRAQEYRKAFPLLIQDWRQQWGQKDFPFYFVQLASYNAANGNSEQGSTWAELREAQSLTLSVPNTGMAVTTDIGEAKDIHPRNKQDVGHRLARIALHDAYGKKIVSVGPTFKSMKVEGNKIRLSFSDLGSGLAIKAGQSVLAGFDLAGEDQKFRPAKAAIEGNDVVVYREDTAKPVAVRYNWADYAGAGNLYNKEGLPAAPFRTDNWPAVTAQAHYLIKK